MHYISKKFDELPDAQKEAVLSEVMSSYTAAPKTTADKYGLALMADFTEEAKERLKNWGQIQGLRSGYHSIDQLTKGMLGGEIVVVAGKTSHGKTTLAINIANRVAQNGARVLFVTLEMTPVEVTSRFMHINKDIPDGYDAASHNIAFQFNDELDWKDVDGLIAKAKRDLEVDLVVIDHLHYFTRELDKVAEDLGRITKEIKKNAIRHNIPVILISHVRKTQTKKEDATIDDLRSSSFIAQDADIVLMVGQSENKPGYVWVKIEKNRNRGFERGNDIDGTDKQVVSLKLDQTTLTDKYDGRA